LMLLATISLSEANVQAWACTNVCTSTATRSEPRNCRLDCAVYVCNPQLADIRGEMLVLTLGSQGRAGEGQLYQEHCCRPALFNSSSRGLWRTAAERCCYQLEAFVWFCFKHHTHNKLLLLLSD
jgi:hypothetical protein